MTTPPDAPAPHVRRALLAAGLIAVASITAFAARQAAPRTPLTIQVTAGSHDRTGTIVSFVMPPSFAAGGAVALRGTDAVLLPLQVDQSRRAWFVLPSLAAGATATFIVERVSGSATVASATRDRGNVTFAVGTRPIATFVGTPGSLPSPTIKPVFLRGGYVHPVRTPSGRIVTDDYPSDHFHHHGIWFAWTKTQFQGRHPDFWNVQAGTGRVDFEKIDTTWSGPVNAGVRARLKYVDVGGPSPVVALNEEWTTRVFAAGEGARPYNVFDVELVQTAIDAPLVLDEYRYGGIGVRGPASSRPLDNAFFLTSEGKDRSNGDATRGRWFHLGSRVDGAMAGIAILGHPDNFRSPEPMRLNPTDPFFCFAPPQLGGFEIKPGTPYVARYRLIAADGAADAGELNRLWTDYATPPVVTVK